MYSYQRFQEKHNQELYNFKKFYARFGTLCIVSAHQVHWGINGYVHPTLRLCTHIQKPHFVAPLTTRGHSR